MVLVGMRDSAPRRDGRLASSSSSSSSSAALYPHQTEAEEAMYGSSAGGEGGAIEAPMQQRLLGTLLLATLVGALLMRGARKLEEWAPPRRDYSLSVKVCKVDPLLVEGEAREGTEGRLKRTLSDIFLARGRRNTRDGGQLGHSLISAVTTSFLGCIAPLATEFER